MVPRRSAPRGPECGACLNMPPPSSRILKSRSVYAPLTPRLELPLHNAAATLANRGFPLNQRSRAQPSSCSWLGSTLLRARGCFFVGGVIADLRFSAARRCRSSALAARLVASALGGSTFTRTGEVRGSPTIEFSPRLKPKAQKQAEKLLSERSAWADLRARPAEDPLCHPSGTGHRFESCGARLQ